VLGARVTSISFSCYAIHPKRAFIHFHYANTTRQFSKNGHDMPVWSIWQSSLRFLCCNLLIQKNPQISFNRTNVVNLSAVFKHETIPAVTWMMQTSLTRWQHMYKRIFPKTTTTTNMLVNLWRTHGIRAFCVIKKIMGRTLDSVSWDFKHHDNIGFQVTLISHIKFNTWGNTVLSSMHSCQTWSISFSAWVRKWLWVKKARNLEVKEC